MVLALFNGMSGLILCLVLGTRYLGLEFEEVMLSVLASNLAALFAVLTTLQAERVHWLKEKCLNKSSKTWAVLLGIYFGIMLSFSPCIREFTIFFTLLFPLILSTGFAIVAFGPIQDLLVRKQQRKSLMTQL